MIKINKKIIITIAIVLIIALIVIVHKKEINSSIKILPPQVELMSVLDYEANNATVFSLGQVESIKQVDLRAQIGGEVNRVNVKIGEDVLKGDLLIELDHSDLDIQLKQAKATVEKAKSVLNQVVAGATDEQIRAAKAQMESAESAYNNAQNSLNDLLVLNQKNMDSAYSKALVSAEDASIKLKSAYTLIDNLQKNYFSRNDQEGIRVRDLRDDTKKRINDLEIELENISNAKEYEKIDILLENLEKILSSTVKVLDEIKDISESLVYKEVVSAQEKAGVEAQKNYIHAMYSGVVTLRSNLSILKTSQEASVSSLNSQLKMAKTNYEAVKAKYESVTANPREVDLSAIKSSIKEAEAARDFIKSKRGKAFICAPFSGKVSSVPVKLNNLVQGGQSVVSILNDTGLQVKTYISDKDSKLIKEGSKVVINNGIEGVVSNISPGLDSATKKIEAKITVVGENDLIVGEYVNLNIFINQDLLKEKFFLPFKSILITSDKNYVFIVNEQNKIERREVQLGEVINESIEITDGLEKDLKIVKSVRGLKEGELVEVK